MCVLWEREEKKFGMFITGATWQEGFGVKRQCWGYTDKGIGVGITLLSLGQVKASILPHFWLSS